MKNLKFKIKNDKLKSVRRDVQFSILNSQFLIPSVTFALITCVLIAVCGCAVNPITGENEMMFFPNEQDIAIGRQYAPEVEKALKGRIEDHSLQNYIDGVGRSVAQISHRPDFDYHFVAVKDKSINAISLPGGYIFITKGMLLKLRNESQLAGVLAHEIVHVAARDTSNMMSKQMGTDILLMAAVSQTSSQGAQAAAEITSRILSVKYSREDERTADLGGLDYMIKAGYDPKGMLDTMQMLENEDEIKPVEFLSTHPSPESRISYLSARIQIHYANGVEGAKVGQEDYERFVLARIKNLPDSTGQQ
jgi:predicted Zn-dependent protease